MEAHKAFFFKTQKFQTTPRGEGRGGGDSWALMIPTVVNLGKHIQ